MRCNHASRSGRLPAAVTVCFFVQDWRLFFLMTHTTPFSRTADIILMFGNRNNGGQSGFHLIGNPLVFQFFRFFTDRIEGMGQFIGAKHGARSFQLYWQCAVGTGFFLYLYTEKIMQSDRMSKSKLDRVRSDELSRGAIRWVISATMGAMGTNRPVLPGRLLAGSSHHFAHTGEAVHLLF
jgi:hypothetical protein